MEKVFLVVLLDKFLLYTPAEGDEEFPPVIKSFVDVVVANRIEHAHNIACKHTGINRELDTNNLVTKPIKQQLKCICTTLQKKVIFTESSLQITKLRDRKRYLLS